MTAKSQPPDRAFHLVAEARNRAWGYHETLEPDHFARIVAAAEQDAGLRADVELVWSLAYETQEDAMRDALAGEVERYADAHTDPAGERNRLLYRVASRLRRRDLAPTVADVEPEQV